MKQRPPTRRKASTELPPRSSNAVLEPEGPFHTDTSLGATRLAWRPEDRFSVTHSGKTEPILPTPDTGIATKSEIERRISEQPTAIRDSARALSQELNSQAKELKQLRWNDPDRIAQRDNLVVLLENMATGLDNLADNLDQAISKASEGKPEPVFLGKAAEVVQRLHFWSMEWLKENRTTLFEVPFRVGIFLTGVIFLHSVGADSTAAIAALGVLAKSTATKKDKTKRQRK